MDVSVLDGLELGGGGWTRGWDVLQLESVLD